MMQTLTPAQQRLWRRAQQEMEDCCYSDAIFLAQCLLRSLPEFLEARQMARKAAGIIFQKNQLPFFEKVKFFFQDLVLRVRVNLFMKQRKLNEALVVLELFLEKAPHHLSANGLMADLGKQWDPPLLSLTLFSLETALAGKPNDIPLNLKLAKASLLSGQNGDASNPERALAAYQHILTLEPHHLEARQGVKNASALLSMR